MTHTWHDTHLVDPADSARVRPARLDHQLRGSSLLTDLHADARVVDPRLAEILDDAAARAAERGHEAGFSAGHAEGALVARADVERLAAAQRLGDEQALGHALARLERLGSALASASDSLESRVVPTYAEVAQDLGTLVCDLVEALLGRELSTDRTHVLDAVRRAAAEAPRNAPLIVRLNPLDHATVLDLHVDLAAIAGRGVEVVVDASIEQGGAIADSGARSIDARLSTALARLRAELAP